MRLISVVFIAGMALILFSGATSIRAEESVLQYFAKHTKGSRYVFPNLPTEGYYISVSIFSDGIKLNVDCLRRNGKSTEGCSSKSVAMDGVNTCTFYDRNFDGLSAGDTVQSWSTYIKNVTPTEEELNLYSFGEHKDIRVKETIKLRFPNFLCLHRYELFLGSSSFMDEELHSYINPNPRSELCYQVEEREPKFIPTLNCGRHIKGPHEMYSDLLEMILDKEPVGKNKTIREAMR